MGKREKLWRIELGAVVPVEPVRSSPQNGWKRRARRDGRAREETVREASGIVREGARRSYERTTERGVGRLEENEGEKR